MSRFLDTNVLLRYFVATDPDKARHSRDLLWRVERGGEKVVTSLMVVAEVVFTLQRTYKVPKARIREMVGDVLSLRSLQLAGKNLCIEALDLYVDKNVSFVDAYNAIFMRSQGVDEIYSWDSDFDKLPGVRRIEPAGAV
jgi:predicted nucleic acid-binding protein